MWRTRCVSTFWAHDHEWSVRLIVIHIAVGRLSRPRIRRVITAFGIPVYFARDLLSHSQEKRDWLGNLLRADTRLMRTGDIHNASPWKRVRKKMTHTFTLKARTKTVNSLPFLLS